MKKTIWRLAALLSCAVLLAAGQASRAAALERKVRAGYERALYQASEQAGDMAVSLEKLLVSACASQEAALLMDVARQADGAVTSLSALPPELPAVGGSLKFVNQTGDYCRRLAERLAAGESAGPEDDGRLLDLLTACRALSSALEEEARGAPAPEADVLFARAAQAVSLDGTQGEESLIRYPTLLYDGPFSDGRDTDSLPALGDAPCDRESALNKARAFVGEDRISACFVTGEGVTPVPVWEITCLTSDGILALAVTRQGGEVLYMLDESPVGGSAYSPAAAIDLAQAFLRDQGYPDMEVSYWTRSGSRLTVNFAAVQQGVILYPDLVKVEMSLGSGRVIGVEATGFFGSHLPRQALTPALSTAEAEERLNRHLTSLRTRLCVIPLDSGEALCYECLCALGEDRYLIYVDALSGEERRIYKIVEDENGALAI